MISCPTCGAANSETREFCLGCMGDLPAARVPAKAAGEASDPGKDAESSDAVSAIEPPAANVAGAAFSESEPLAIPSSACPRHPEMPAAGTCVRCGTFYCAKCVPSVLEQNIECPNCLETKEERNAPATAKAIIREQWITLVLLGLLVGGINFALVISRPEQFNTWSDGVHAAIAALSGAIVALPFLIAALVVGLVRRMWASWVGYAIEALMFLVIALSALGFNLVTAIALGAPIWSLGRILRLAELAKKYPGVLAASRNL
jgi:hypothetical protein